MVVRLLRSLLHSTQVVLNRSQILHRSQINAVGAARSLRGHFTPNSRTTFVRFISPTTAPSRGQILMTLPVVSQSVSQSVSVYTVFSFYMIVPCATLDHHCNNHSQSSDGGGAASLGVYPVLNTLTRATRCAVTCALCGPATRGLVPPARSPGPLPLRPVIWHLHPRTELELSAIPRKARG